MENSNYNPSPVLRIIFRSVLFFMAFYFGQLPGIIIGMLRGAGGSIIPYALIYIFVALKPQENRRLAYVIVLANGLAIILDLVSVYLGEYLLVYAMIDLPFELASLLTIVIYYYLQNRRRVKIQSSEEFS
ncbi:MAG: hypothetical protein B5M54_04255 [Candidatus Aminicenantes bacterium 4484_214]|nr:MAG: hypothetical protein B5M54_04255 [Candidatus Aminicenantes bacterium 4484_214]